MLEGLESVEIKLKDCKDVIDFRIDANTYKKDYIKTAKLLNTKKTETIDSMSISVQNFGAYSLCNFINFQDSGIPFLMTENIRHNYINWNIQKYVDDESHELLWKSHSSKNQVLITMAGEYLGRVAVYDKEFVSSSNQAIAKITLKKSYKPYYISTFLNCRHGQNQINRLKTITGQPNINMSLIKSLEIILLSDSFQETISNLIEKALAGEEESKKQYVEAEDILLKEIGFLNWIPTPKNNNIKTFKETFLESGRIDAEYYQTKYDEILQTINAYKGKITTVSKCFSIVKDEAQIALDVHRYIEIGDINISNGEIYSNEIATENLPANAKIKVSKNHILISKVRPYRGAISFITESYDNLIASGALTVLAETGLYPKEVLITLLKTNAYKELMMKYNVGSSYPVIRDEDILSLPIPILSPEKSKLIVTKITDSFFLQKQTKDLLDLANEAVEIAIEQSEKAAINYLKNLNYA